MQLSFPDGPEERRAMTLASGVVILSIISIIVFLVARGGIWFYIFAALTVIAFLYMAYDLSRPRQATTLRAAGARPEKTATPKGGRAKARGARRRR